MRVTENRKLALTACILCALISIFVIGGLKLKGRHSDVRDIFVNGSDAQHNIEYYLERGTGYASDLAYEAMQYLEDDAAALRIIDLCGEISAQEGPAAGRYDLFAELTNDVELLFSELQAAGHADETNIELAYYDYQSICDLIKRDDYHDAAEEYNKLADAFPANIIAGIWGAGEAETFGR